MKEQFLTWALTLFATLGGIWLKDYLDTKKSKTLNKIQKAIKTYAILSKLPSSLSAKALICQELLKNKDFNYTSLFRRPDLTHLYENVIYRPQWTLEHTLQDLIDRERADK